MKTFCTLLLASALLTVPVFAGALLLQVGDPAVNPEAIRAGAVLVARVTACHSPEKTTLTATAEGTLNGARTSVPLKVIALSSPGTFAIEHAWPTQGKWAVKIVATNPDYKNYATSVVVPIQSDSLQLDSVRHYFHAPTETELSSAIN